MARTSIPLDMIRVASPCQESWDDMQGNGTVRFCGRCETHVYNLSAMSRRQAEQLVEETEGRLCVRFYQRRDGSMMTRDCPVAVRTFRRWLAIMIGSAATFLFMLVSVSLAVIGLGRSATTEGNGNRSGPGITRTTNNQFWQSIRNWIDPAPPVVMGDMAPVPDCVMGSMIKPVPEQGAE